MSKANNEKDEESDTEVLSQDEIDMLLAAIESGEIDPEKYVDNRDRRKIRVYDFKRPDKFSKDQIRTISMISETFARQLTTKISYMLDDMAHCHVACVEQLTYEEYIRSIPNPCTVLEIDMIPLKGVVVLDFDLTTTNAIISRLCGIKEERTDTQRYNTKIEQKLLTLIYPIFENTLKTAWSRIVDINPAINRLENNPQFIQIVAPSDMVVVISFETRIGNTEREAHIHICIPYSTLKPIIKKISGRQWYESNTKKTLRKPNPKNFKTEIALAIDTGNKTLDEISGFIEGTVIPIDISSGFITANGEKISEARVTLTKTKKVKVGFKRNTSTLKRKSNVKADKMIKPSLLSKIFYSLKHLNR